MHKTAWQIRRESELEYVQNATKCVAVLDTIGDIPEVGYVYVTQYMKRLDLEPLSIADATSLGIPPMDARALAMHVVSRLKESGIQPPTVQKTFDATTGRITYSMVGPLPGWKINISGGEPRCRVRKISKEVLVDEKPATAAVPAHTVMQDVYEIENPEECGAEA